jgi:hemin uptake protein HemP
LETRVGARFDDVFACSETVTDIVRRARRTRGDDDGGSLLEPHRKISKISNNGALYTLMKTHVQCTCQIYPIHSAIRLSISIQIPWPTSSLIHIHALLSLRSSKLSEPLQVNQDIQVISPIDFRNTLRVRTLRFKSKFKFNHNFSQSRSSSPSTPRFHTKDH